MGFVDKCNYMGALGLRPRATWVYGNMSVWDLSRRQIPYAHVATLQLTYISVLRAIIAKAISPMSQHRWCSVCLLDNDLFLGLSITSSVFGQSWNARIAHRSFFFWYSLAESPCCYSSSLDVAGHAKREHFWGGWTSGIHHSSHATWSVMTSRTVAMIHLCMPYYPVRVCTTGLSVWFRLYVYIYICVYMWPKKRLFCTLATINRHKSLYTACT